MQLMTAAVSSGELTMRVRRALNQCGYSALRSVAVSTMPDGVCLSGVVSTYYLKQLAQALAMETEGVAIVSNELVVE